MKSYYTVTASFLTSLDISDPAITNIRLNILLQNESQLTPRLFDRINALANESMISLGASLFQNKDSLASVLPALFILVSLNRSSAGQKTIPVFSDDIVPDLEMIHTYFQEQGVTDLQFAVFNATQPGIQTTGGYNLLLLANPEPAIDRQGIPGKPSQPWIFASIDEITSQEEFTEFREQLVCIEKNDFQATGIEQFFIEKDEFEHEKKLWKKRALLYHDFLPLSKRVQEKEYNDVIAWYHKEYEVLPIWYKRLGHIIKVLTGKRQLRSLFSDKLKRKKT